MSNEWRPELAGHVVTMARRHDRNHERRTTVSQKTVQLIIGRLVTDEEYRLRFLSDSPGTLTALRDQGVDLTRSEIEALARTDRTLWTDTAERIDAHLQRSNFRNE